MLGLFTTKAYAEPASQTPLLHRKLRQILRSEDLIEGSHDYKAAVSLFDSFPKDELFAASTDDLRGAVVALLGLQGDAGAAARPPRPRRPQRVADRRAAALALRRRAARRACSDLLPRALRAPTPSTPTSCSARATACRSTSASTPPTGCPTLDFRELEREVVALTRTWDDELRDALVARHGEAQGRVLAARWARALPALLQGRDRAGARPSHDIGCFERLETLGEPFVVGLQNETDQRGDRTRVGLYKSGGKVELVEAMPMLEDLGLRVIEEVPTRLRGGDGETWVQDFGVLGPGDRPLDLEAYGAPRGRLHRRRLARRHRVRLAQPARARGRARLAPDRDPARLPQVPPAHRLALHRELPERRAGGATPRITAKLVQLFELRFDPEHARDEAAEAALREEILADLDAVESLDHDRILRNQLGLIEATLRTNAYRRGRGAMAFKLRSADVPAMPAAGAAVRDLRLLGRRWRASTCAAAGSRAAASAGRTAWTTAPRSSA